jgi:cobalt/nickel transport system ATP-binding protein
VKRALKFDASPGDRLEGPTATPDASPQESSAAGPLLAVRGLSYRYPDGTAALEAISFTLSPGERLAIVGPNGAGKSTLLLHLNGLLEGTGEVEVAGTVLSPSTMRTIRQQVGLVFQNPDDQLFCPTVFEDVAFGPRNLGLEEPEVELRVREALGAVGLVGFGPRNPAHLSIGEKKRAAIATVCSMRPRIYVLDEPTSSLDARGRRDLLGLLTRLGEAQIIVTHDLALVRAVCSRVLVMGEGKVLAQGPVSEVLSDVTRLERWGLA